MADVTQETPLTVAKELTLAAVKVLPAGSFGEDAHAVAKKLGEMYGVIYEGVVKGMQLKPESEPRKARQS